MKSRRDITLGEMQDECKGQCFCSRCKYEEVCMYNKNDSMNAIDLTDKPAFTADQVAFWRGWYGVGARCVKRRIGTACVDFSLTTEGLCASYTSVIPKEIANELEEGKVYDLAELLEEDA